MMKCTDEGFPIQITRGLVWYLPPSEAVPSDNDDPRQQHRIGLTKKLYSNPQNIQNAFDTWYYYNSGELSIFTGQGHINPVNKTSASDEQTRQDNDETLCVQYIRRVVSLICWLISAHPLVISSCSGCNMSLKLILVSKLGVGCPRFAYKLIRTVAVKQGGGIANKSNKQGKAFTPQFWRGSKEVQCKNGNIASHKLPGK